VWRLHGGCQSDSCIMYYITLSLDKIGPVFERFVGRVTHCAHGRASDSCLRAAILYTSTNKTRGPGGGGGRVTAAVSVYGGRGIREEELLQTRRRAWTPDGVRSRRVVPIPAPTAASIGNRYIFLYCCRSNALTCNVCFYYW